MVRVRDVLGRAAWGLALAAVVLIALTWSPLLPSWRPSAGSKTTSSPMRGLSGWPPMTAAIFVGCPGTGRA